MADGFVANDVDFLKFPVEWFKAAYPNDPAKQRLEIEKYMKTLVTKVESETKKAKAKNLEKVAAERKVDQYEKDLKKCIEESEEKVRRANAAEDAAIKEKKAVDGKISLLESKLTQVESKVAAQLSEPQPPPPQPITPQMFASQPPPPQIVYQTVLPIHYKQAALEYADQLYYDKVKAFEQRCEELHWAKMYPCVQERDRLRAQVVDLQNDITDLRAENSDLKVRCGLERPALSARERELERVNKKMQVSDVAHKDRRREPDRLRGYKESASKRIEKQEDELDVAREAKLDGDRKMGTLSMQISGLDQNNERMASTINLLERNQKSENKQHEKRVSLLRSQHTGEIERLWEEHECEIRRSEKKHQEELCRLDASKKILLAELSVAHTEISDLEEDQRFLEKYSERLHGEKERIQHRLDYEQSRNQQNTASISLLTKENASFRKYQKKGSLKYLADWKTDNEELDGITTEELTVLVNLEIEASKKEREPSLTSRFIQPFVMAILAIFITLSALSSFAASFLQAMPSVSSRSSFSSTPNTHLSPINTGSVSSLSPTGNILVSGCSSTDILVRLSVDNHTQSLDNYLSQIHTLVDKEMEEEKEKEEAEVPRVVTGRYWSLSTVGKVVVGVVIAGVVVWRLTS